MSKTKIDIEGSWGIEVKTLKNILVGRTIKAIRFSNDNLILEFDKEYLSLEVIGDCCSTSYFYDFYGVERVVNKKIIDFNQIDLDPTDLKANANEDPGELIQVYGYKITCEPNDDLYETSNTAVFSFRNASNGYYGGFLIDSDQEPKYIPEIKKDTIL